MGIYFALTNVANIIQYTIAKYYFPFALLAIFYLDVSLKNTITYKTKLKYILYYVIISIVIEGIIQILDPLYLQYFYIAPLLWKLIPIGIAFVIDLIIKYFQAKRRST